MLPLPVMAYGSRGLSLEEVNLHDLVKNGSKLGEPDNFLKNRHI